MKKLNELIETVEEKITPDETYISMVFRFLEIFIRDFGCDVIGEYFPQITNKYYGESIRTCWWRKYSQIDRETFNYQHITIERDGDDWKFDCKLKLGDALDMPGCTYTYTVEKCRENEEGLNIAFKKEWQELFRNEKNDFIGIILVNLNHGVRRALIKAKPHLKDVEGFDGDIREFMKTEYAYVPSEEVLVEANKILEKLRA